MTIITHAQTYTTKPLTPAENAWADRMEEFFRMYDRRSALLDTAASFEAHDQPVPAYLLADLERVNAQIAAEAA